MSKQTYNQQFNHFALRQGKNPETAQPLDHIEFIDTLKNYTYYFVPLHNGRYLCEIYCIEQQQRIQFDADSITLIYVELIKRITEMINGTFDFS